MANLLKHKTNAHEETRGTQGFSSRSRQLQEIYKRHWQDVCRYINIKFNGGPPEPEDVAQAAFAKLAEVDDLETIRSPHAFLLRTASNIAIQELRKETTRRVHKNQVQVAGATDGESSDPVDDMHPERVAIGQENMRAINKAIDAMPLLNRQLLAMSRIDGLSYAEIARRTGISQTHVKRLIAQAIFECKRACTEPLAPYPGGEKQ